MQNNKGASLVELSVVLTIIGLLLAATVQGISLRKSAEVRSFMTDVNVFQNAIGGFYAKYNAIPGDMSDAYTYWSTNCVPSSGDATADAALCNGNGNGQITVDSGGTDSEAFRAWQHLVLSEFLEGAYPGTATGTQANIGINVPGSRRTTVGYSFAYATTGSAGNRNEISLGGFVSSAVNTGPALLPSEALSIDLKLDDGIPATGAVFSVDGAGVTAGNCMSGSGSSSTYTVATTTISCRMTFPVKM